MGSNPADYQWISQRLARSTWLGMLPLYAQRLNNVYTTTNRGAIHRGRRGVGVLIPSLSHGCSGLECAKCLEVASTLILLGSVTQEEKPDRTSDYLSYCVR